jgi:hypothetical protein
MLKQGIKESLSEHDLRTDSRPEAEINVEGSIVKHIKKIAPQLSKNVSGNKPIAQGPGTNGGCIPVGN